MRSSAQVYLAYFRARLVANIRSREKELYVDPYPKQASGKHGELLGNRFLDLMPQLQTMISARTKHLDDCLENAITNGVEQVVMLGSGLDFRPYRFAEKYKTHIPHPKSIILANYF